ncbi:MAG TPA: helix-turn-helix domain-containing protein [Ktedonobacteraceae bacterium]|nr:helix-turn-helix domain-containing protein [Ktedonobacteraceae bacterium]
MFTVGEFSQLAQVSKRLLRYYDEIGLLKPMHTDRITGYRYYSAEQMLHLNRILALKDLGLSLDQIQRIVRENVSTEEINGMLLLKKAEIEQQVQAELQPDPHRLPEAWITLDELPHHSHSRGHCGNSAGLYRLPL